ncbi:LPS-assembly protein LptD [Sphingomonas koreensis]|nr:LPS-assembly protein LptD [Sphingomonas koreensis]
MSRRELIASCTLPLALFAAGAARAQDLNDRPAGPPPPSATPLATDANQVDFSAGALEYDMNADVVTATGDVRMFRQGNRLRADKVVWNRKTGAVVATGDIAVTNPQGDVAYGDSINLTDTLKDGVVQNMLLVLDQGGRLAAQQGTRDTNGVVTLKRAAYTPCDVTNAAGCPKEPSWKVTAVSVTYRPDRERIYYKGAQFHLFGLPGLPLPDFSNPIGGQSSSGLLTPDIQIDHTNGLEIGLPYYFKLAPNRGLTITPRIFTSALPMLEAQYDSLSTLGSFSVTAYGTYSRQNDDIAGVTTNAPGENDFRGYFDASGRFQLDPNWSVSGSIRIASDKTFLRRYDISRDDRLRSTIDVERIDKDSYFSIAGWAVQTLRIDESQHLQPLALPEIDYRRRIADPWLGGTFTFQLNSLALDRSEGQDTQRAFASAQWQLNKLTRWGQEVTFTAYGRGDIYHTNDTLATTIASYRGNEGFDDRFIGALAVDVKWPLIGNFLSGTQRLTPRVQFVASPHTGNLSIPNEDARAVDLEDSNLFALNRFPGYDRWEDSTRVTYGADWSVDLPNFSVDATVGQSYRLASQPTLFPDGTGLNGRFSDIVGRTELRYRDFVSLTHRYRLDKDGLAIRRNEVDATVGSRATYVLVGYLRLNRNIDPSLEDLRDSEEIRLGGRVQVGRFWSAFGSTVIDLTDRKEDPLSLADGFDPVRHRLGVAYEDDCLKLGVTWKRDYQNTGDAQRGNSYLLTLAFKNLGR